MEKLIALLGTIGMTFVGLAAIASERQRADLSAHPDIAGFVTSISNMSLIVIGGSIMIAGFGFLFALLYAWGDV